MLNAEETRDGCSDTAIWPPDIGPKKNLHDEVAVSFRARRFLVALRRLFHSGVLPAGLDRKRNRAIRLDSFPELLLTRLVLEETSKKL
jgi:hypothetical protein